MPSSPFFSLRTVFEDPITGCFVVAVPDDHATVVMLGHWVGFVLVQQPSDKSRSRGDLSCLVKIGF